MSIFNNNLLAGASAQGGTTPVHTIDQSIRFNQAENASMSRTPSSASSRTTWTFSWWWKRGNLSGSTNGTNQRQPIFGTTAFSILSNHNSTQIDGINVVFTGATNDVQTSEKFRDTSAWYNFQAVLDTTNDVASERFRLYKNGQRITDFASISYPAKDTEYTINNTQAHYIGFRNSGENLDGYLAEIVFIDGQALDPSSFGEYNSSNIWIPKSVSGLTFGTNGFHIKGQLAGKTNAITALGNIQHSTAQSKIGNSSILFDGNGDLLEVGGSSNWYDFGADGNPWTMEAYIRFDTVSITQKIFWQDNTFIGISYVTGSGIKVQLNNGGINFTASFSPSINTWYHLAVVRETSNTTTVYIDGTSIGSGTISGGSGASHKVEIGAQSPSTDEFDGYMDEIRISSVARFTSSFTPTTSEYTADGDTLALIHSNTTNGSTVFKNDVGFGNDSSGNQNNFETSGLAAHDQVSDSPTNNFAVFNPVMTNDADFEFSEGNLKLDMNTNKSWYVGAGASMSMTSGKWYWESYWNSGDSYTIWGILDTEQLHALAGSSGSTPIYDLNFNGIQPNTSGTNDRYRQNATTDDTGQGASPSNIWMFALDMDNKKMWLGYNGTWIGSGDPAGGTNETWGSSDIASSSYTPINQGYQISAHSILTYNFGQEGTFAGNTTAGGNSDGNGIGNFKYSVPSGYKALCTKNLGS